MNEKLNEILEKAENRIAEFENDIIQFDYQIGFLTEHGFTREVEWIRHKRESMSVILWDFCDTVNDIRDLLNNEVIK